MRRLLVLVVLVAGCGGSKAAAPVKPRATAAPTATPVLTGAAKCGEATCSTLKVPLDRSRPDGETLALKVVVDGPQDAPVFVFLSGGPGEPGVPFVARARKWLGPVAKQVRIVAFDQRGTGADALDCPALQKEMGASDLSPPTQDAVTSCASKVGDKRQFFTTADTVDDLEALRIALHADKLTLDGISYGTYTAQRYALAHPQRVKALVLDSVVPAEGVSLLTLTQMQATRRVLGPEHTKALATVVKDEGNGPQLLDTLTSLSVGRPPQRRLPEGHRPGEPRRRRLIGAVAERRRQERPPLQGGAAQPGPAREHVVRGHARAVGRRLGAARRPPEGA